MDFEDAAIKGTKEVKNMLVVIKRGILVNEWQKA